ncbi:Nucleolar protein 56, partial [Bos mutus]
NSSSAPGQRKQTRKTGKKRRPRRASGEQNGRPVSLLSKPKKEKSSSKKELAGSDLEETASTVSLPKRKNSSPKGEPDNDPEESGNKSDPKKKRKFSPKEKPLSSGPEEAATARAVAARK